MISNNTQTRVIVRIPTEDLRSMLKKRGVVVPEDRPIEVKAHHNPVNKDYGSYVKDIMLSWDVGEDEQ